MMGYSAGKNRKRYVDRPSVKYKTCLIHDTSHFSDRCKVLGYFGTKYAKGRPKKDRGYHNIPRKIINSQQKHNSIVNNVVDEILLHETQKVSAAREAPEFLDSDYDENDIYQV